MINVQILDDHKLIVDSLCKLINDSDFARITDVFYDVLSCRKGLLINPPDILMLDIGLPDGDGVDFCCEAIKHYPNLKIIMLTTYKEFNIVKRTLKNGALGYILKNASIEEMLVGLKVVSEGKLFLCEETNMLVNEEKDKEAIWLTPREKQILQYIADGYTTKEIANFIFRDSETVKTYRKNLLLKFAARNVAELIKKSYEMRMIH